MQFERAVAFITKKLASQLSSLLTYHSIQHTLDVYEAAKSIGEKENITPREMKLLLTAASYHDAGFLNCVAGHEDESCKMARDTLPNYGYLPLEIGQICQMIMATKIPQTPKNHLEEILADADLDYLGRDDFFTINDKLYNEVFIQGTFTNKDDWYKTNIAFMENHCYFTEASTILRLEKKENNSKQIKSYLNK
jgi:uncharacterized protein